MAKDRPPTQRDVMRRLMAKHRLKDETCAAYVKAEANGEAIRRRRNCSPEEYADRLWHDGQIKGWLKQ
jgi:hypothetical protein